LHVELNKISELYGDQHLALQDRLMPTIKLLLEKYFE